MTDIEPCPVSWCERFGRHRFEDEVLGSDTEHTRGCTHPEPTITGHVAAEVVTRADGMISDPVVIVDLDDTHHEVHKPYDMAVLINAAIAAAETAWPGFADEYGHRWPRGC